MAKAPKDELKYLESKLKQNPNSILFARLADVYLALDRVDEALELCEQGIKKHPYYVTGHYIMSKCYLKKKQFDHAEKELKRVLLFDPEFIAAHREYGNLMAQIGWMNTCESSYEKIFEIDPLSTNAKQDLRELKQRLNLQKDTGPEAEIEEFEEEAMVSSESIEEQAEKEEKETIEEFEEIFSEAKDTTTHVKEEDEAPFTQDDEEKFSYILDDIFRDDSVNEPSANLDNPPFEEQEDETTQPAEQKETFSLEDDVPEWLDEDDTAKSDDVDETLKQLFDEEDEKQLDSKKEELEDSGILHEEKEIASIISDDSPSVIQDWTDDSEAKPIQSSDSHLEEKEQKFQKREKEKIVTPTLGEIYTAQHQYAKAIGVYEILKKNNPDNPIYEQKIEYLKKKLEEDQNLDN